MNLFEFAEVINGTLELRRLPKSGRWSAYFDHAEIKDNKNSAILASASGHGTTPDGALQDYVKEIRGKHIVFNATSKEYRREYGVPKTLAHNP